MPHDGEKRRRVSLTRNQLHDEQGAELLALLSEIIADGKLTDDEIQRLTDWLIAHQGCDLPAVEFLVECVHGVVSRGHLSESDRLELQLGIEKVLPVSHRGFARHAREAAHPAPAPDPADKSLPRITADDLKRMAQNAPPPLRGPRHSDWRDDSMTEPQRHFIKSLGGTIRADATKGEASELIDQLLNGHKPISSRQQMVLRFWGHSVPAGQGCREIMTWMDEFYHADPDRKVAWELFKQESEDNGLQGDPSRVPVGIGPQYLARVKAGGSGAIPRFRTNERAGDLQTRVVAIAITVAALVFAVLMIAAAFRTNPKPAAKMPVQAAAPKAPKSPPVRPPVRDLNAFADVPAAAVSKPATAANVAPAVQHPYQAPKPTDAASAVSQLAVTGIVGGSRPRAMVNGVLLRERDVVNQQFGVFILTIDEQKRLVVFADMSGVEYVRRLGDLPK